MRGHQVMTRVTSCRQKKDDTGPQLLQANPSMSEETTNSPCNSRYCWAFMKGRYGDGMLHSRLAHCHSPTQGKLDQMPLRAKDCTIDQTTAMCAALLNWCIQQDLLQRDLIFSPYDFTGQKTRQTHRTANDCQAAIAAATAQGCMPWLQGRIR